MTQPPPITIGLPVYNGERYLGAAIDSILAQTFADFVLFVSDNASTDSTSEIVQEYARRDARVVFSRSPENRGAIWNFNHVFAECRSPYFKWAAADDMLAPTCVERCLETLRAAPPAVALVYPRTTMIGPDGEVVGEVDDRLDARESSPYRRLHHVVMNMVYGNVLFAVMRSDTLRRTSGHGSFPSGDLVLLAELALLGEFWELPERLFLRREHEGMSRKAHESTARTRRLARSVDELARRRAVAAAARVRGDGLALAVLARLEAPAGGDAARDLGAPLQRARPRQGACHSPRSLTARPRVGLSSAGNASTSSGGGVARHPSRRRTVFRTRIRAGRTWAAPGGVEAACALERGELGADLLRPAAGELARFLLEGGVVGQAVVDPGEASDDDGAVGRDRAGTIPGVDGEQTGGSDGGVAARRHPQPHLVVDRCAQRRVERADAPRRRSSGRSRPRRRSCAGGARAGAPRRFRAARPAGAATASPWRCRRGRPRRASRHPCRRSRPPAPARAPPPSPPDRSAARGRRCR